MARDSQLRAKESHGAELSQLIMVSPCRWRTAAPDVQSCSWPLPLISCTMGKLDLDSSACLLLDSVAKPFLKAGGLHDEKGTPLSGSAPPAIARHILVGSIPAVAQPILQCPATHLSIGYVVSLPTPAHSPSPQHSAPCSGNRAVSQPSIWFPWHRTSLKFLKIAGMLMLLAPLFPTLKQILPFLYYLAGSFLSLAEGGSLGGRWTSVLSFPVFHS